ncbi:uncharacterized protein LOC113240257, partial [Hyposmocoma kahamanoa]|uniref:uncharacterized protein LOC113240257 n=1 Tax=Hyposmocoma kahamanoa TaxID=1477025 RepID=UPI000E6D964C
MHEGDSELVESKLQNFEHRPSNNLTFVDHVAYFTELIQETVYELEKHGWWNLKMINYTQTIKQTIYDWNFEATATYHDGFLMSIERIDLRDIRQRFDTNSTTQE